MAEKRTKTKTTRSTTKKTTGGAKYSKANKKKETKSKSTGAALKDPHRTPTGRFAPGNPGKPPGTKNKTNKSTKLDIWAALERASKALGKEECFDPLKELISAITAPEIEPVDKGMLCARLLEFLYPKKRAVDVTLEPEHIPAINVTMMPDADGADFINKMIPKGQYKAGEPVVLQIGGAGNEPTD